MELVSLSLEIEQLFGYTDTEELDTSSDHLMFKKIEDLPKACVAEFGGPKFN